MPIGNKNRTNSDKKMIFVNIVTKDKDDKDIRPYFSFKEGTGEGPDGKKIYSEVAKDTAFSGNLIKVETYDKEIKSKNIIQPRVKILFEDEDSIYYADVSYTILSRSLFNSLLSLQSMEDLSLSIYWTKPNDKNKVYPQLCLRQGEGKDNMVRWLYSKEELPEIKKVKIKGKEMSDTEDIDNFFREKLNEKFATMPEASDKSGKAAGKSASKPKSASKTVKDDDDQAGDSEIPF